VFLSACSAAPSPTSVTADQASADNPPALSVEQRQEAFLDLEFGLFIHYNMATYKNTQWVAGYHSPADFNPGVETIDTDAWADAAKSAGMTYAVLTTKHVAGFCLWDSKYTTYDVMHPDSGYPKDLVAQFVKSFTERGMKVGLYYCWRSPGFADRYKVLPPECDPATHAFDEQVAFQKKQVAELVEKYSEVFYIWNDGLDDTIMTADQANAFIRSLGPNVIASGNWWDWKKKGTPFLDIAVKEMRELPPDNTHPAETCWCLEQKWFWQDGFEPKDARQIVDRIDRANQRRSNFLLNVATDRNGRFSDASVKVLAEIGRLRHESR